MPFQTGSSGNPKGRPKQTEEQKNQTKQFKEMLKQATVPALQGIIEIASDKRSKDRFNACKYIIDKAFGPNAELLVEDDLEPITIKLVTLDPRIKKDSGNDENWID
jgi:hypothetical protein